MIDDLKHHLFHYLLLAFILLTGLIVFFSFPHQPPLQWLVAIAMALSYVLWGIGHHVVIEKHVPWSIVIEYILIALIGLILIRGVLL